MRFAISDHAKLEAKPGALGRCPSCRADLVPKCGTRRVWHWAHKGRRHCDQWWENETPWHRKWKENFPSEWQEVAVRGADGELHIADIKTPSGLVVEFQHSSISTFERQSRELFYGNMIWVLDGLRTKSDRHTFFAHVESKSGRWDNSVWTVKLNPLVPRITQRWIDSQKTVFLDFDEEYLWRIPVEQDGWGKHAAKIPKSDFLNDILVQRLPFGV